MRVTKLHGLSQYVKQIAGATLLGHSSLDTMAGLFRLPCGNGLIHQKDDRRLLLAKAEFLDNGFIAVGIVCLEVSEQAPTLADQHEKTAARAVVLLVSFEVLRQVANTFA